MEASNARNIFTAVVLLLLVAALTALDAAVPRVDAGLPSSARTACVAAGAVDESGPVYRLPPVAVIASRDAELAKIAREEALALR